MKPNTTPAAVLQLLAKFPPSSAVALVGHEPSLSRAAASLIGRSGDARIDLKKSGALLVSFPGAATLGSGALEALLKPKMLRRVGGSR